MLDHVGKSPATSPATTVSQHERKRQHEYDYAWLRSNTRRCAVRVSTGKRKYILVYLHNGTELLA